MSTFPPEGPSQRVLLTGARSPAGPDLVRWLSRSGHEVWVADSIFWPLTRAARNVRGYLRYPSPRSDFAGFASWFDRHRSTFDLIWPGCEEVLWLAQVPGLPLFAPPFHQLRTVHGKDTLKDLVNNLVATVASPITMPVEPSRAVPAGFIAKPRYGRFGHRTIHGPARLPADVSTSDWVLQPRIVGRERCMHVIADHGEVRALALYQDPNRRGSGPCTVFQREHSRVLEDFATVFCAKHQWTGSVGFDILTDAEDRHWVVDINPRLTSGMHLIARPTANRVALSPFRAWREGCESALSEPHDSGPLLLAPLTVLELMARFRTSLPAAATVDLQWP